MSRRFPFGPQRDSGTFIVGTRVELLTEPVLAFDAMIREIDQAKHQVLLEMYWFASDTVGWRFCEHLCQAAARGVWVAVMYDALGSWDTDEALFETLRAAGVEVIEYGPIAPWRRRFAWRRLSLRDHRKILVVDGKVGFTGGLNLSKESLPVAAGGDGWRDDAVRLEGPAVAALADCFWQTHRRERGRQTMHPHVSEAAPVADAAMVRVLSQNGPRRRYQILSAYLERIRGAKQRVWLKNAYFIPDRRVRKALSEAARRGVDVRVVVPMKSDVPIAKYAGQRTFGGLMRNGVRLFAWLPSVLHSKTAVVDGLWSTVGTFNLDHMSFRTNLEVNVGVLDAGFAQQMEASFLADLEQCREIVLSEFERRSFVERSVEFFLYQFRRFL
ncbi:MAG: phospholipase D-like domain-containing protein [Polyangiaceae bacterium]|nr:phospholipase D-like domain-containing protein [Polyangiaceae bacterium]